MLHCDLDEEIYREKIHDFRIINKISNYILVFISFIVFIILIKCIFYL